MGELWYLAFSLIQIMTSAAKTLELGVFQVDKMIMFYIIKEL